MLYVRKNNYSEKKSWKETNDFRNVEEKSVKDIYRKKACFV